MSIFAIIGLLFDVLTSLPQLFQLIKSIIALIKNKPKEQQAGLMTELMSAYQVAHNTGNAEPLNAIHAKLCNGVGCAPDIKGE